MSVCFRFLNTAILGSPPASINAFAKSYSQFVPGNTGINIFGLAIFILCMNYNKSNKVIELISKNTLGIYLIHIPVLRFIEQIIDVKIITTNICISFLYTGIVVIITLLLSLGIKKLPIVNGLLRF